MMFVMKGIFDRTSGKDVIIYSKPYGDTAMKEFKGKVISYCAGQATETFLELDTGELINTHYIISIKVQQ